MYLHYYRDYFDFDYYVTWDEVRCTLKEMLGKDLEEYCEQEGFEDEYDLADWFRDDLKDYFYEEALEWYRENR